MAAHHYERLTQFDNTFLVFEDPCAHMHVGSTQIFDAGPLHTPGGGVDVEKIRDYVVSRLHRIPRYRQRLAWTPLARHPVWVDDDRFNIFYHVRHSRLPAPGDARQLKRVAGRIMSQPLDLHKPLWEMWVIEGLDGNKFATVTKVHHCMIDGISGVDLISTLLTTEPARHVDPPHPWVPRPAPGRVELLRDEVLQRVAAPLAAAGSLWNVARDGDHEREQLGERLRATAEVIRKGATNASSTPLNQPIGGYWRFDWLSTDLDAIRTVKTRLGGTVNDVVLAVVAGAVRRYLADSRGMNLGGLDFRVMAPVSTRSNDQRGALGNQVSAWIVPLPLQEPDPTRRLQRIAETTSELKASKLALGTETLTLASGWMGTGLLSLVARLAQWGRPFNMVVTNVPGPPLPLYMLGSRLLDAYPMVPLFGNLSSGIALFSYAGSLYWGIMADWETVPDLHDFTAAIESSFAELRDAAERPVVELRGPSEKARTPAPKLATLRSRAGRGVRRRPIGARRG